AFATMLASFLTGIALGAALAARFATSPRRAAAGFGSAQCASALLSLAAFALLQQMPALAARLAAGGAARLGVDALAAGFVMLPSTLSIGATFPFAVRVLARSEADAGPASARVSAWNPAGAIAGALGSGFFLIPALGFAATLAGGTALNLLLAAASAWLVRPPRRVLIGAAAAGIALLALLPPQTPWRVLRLSPLTLTPLQGALEYFSVGRSTTVLLLESQGRWWLTNNGLPEAALAGRATPPSVDRTVQWMAILPALARAELRSMLVIGFGGGLLLEWIPPSVEQV